MRYWLNWMTPSAESRQLGVELGQLAETRFADSQADDPQASDYAIVIWERSRRASYEVARRDLMQDFPLLDVAGVNAFVVEGLISPDNGRVTRINTLTKLGGGLVDNSGADKNGYPLETAFSFFDRFRSELDAGSGGVALADRTAVQLAEALSALLTEREELLAYLGALLEDLDDADRTIELLTAERDRLLAVNRRGDKEQRHWLLKLGAKATAAALALAIPAGVALHVGQEASQATVESARSQERTQVEIFELGHAQARTPAERLAEAKRLADKLVDECH